MKYKVIPEDFIVNEIFDLKQLKKKDEMKGPIYYYFVLKKRDYTQMKALDAISRIFKVSKKDIHFAGTKDRIGITTQIISVKGINRHTFQNNINFFNERINDMWLKDLGIYKSRVNLGDNLGNDFEIICRDIEEEDYKKAKQKAHKIQKSGVLNYFDEQRFGYANNSHIIGKLILQNKIEEAVFEILTSTPPKIRQEHQDFLTQIKENWDKIKDGDKEFIHNLIQESPRFLRQEVLILKHLSIHQNDFPGAFRTIHKKIRTLYLNALQSDIFNKTIEYLDKENLLENLNQTQLELVSKEYNLEENTPISNKTKELLEEYELTLENFDIKHMPELELFNEKRNIYVEVENLEIGKLEKDEIYENKSKVKITFRLTKGSYATNVIKQLFL